MNILITGGAGYIGNSLYNFLTSKNFNVTCITRQDVDLTDTAAVLRWFENKYFDIVIHSAVTGGSRLRSESSKDLIFNLRMYYNLVNCSKHFNKFIHFGSGAELYSKTSYYGLSKYVINEDIQDKDNFYNLRIYAVFDENELSTRFIKANLLNYINKQSLLVHSDRVMDFFYMEDLHALVNEYVVKDNLPKVVECSYSTHHSLLDIAHFINTLESYKVNITIQSEIKANPYIGSLSNIQTSVIGLFKGIERTYRKLKTEYHIQ